MVLILQYYGLQYEKLFQMLVELEYILRGVRRIKINVDIELGHHPPQDQRTMYLGFDL